MELWLAWSMAPVWPWPPWDIIKYSGGLPANSSDVGGGASAEQVKKAFRILLSDAGVKAVLSTFSAASAAAMCWQPA